MTDEITLTINPNRLPILAGEGKGIILNPQAEQSLIQLLEYQRKVEETIDRVKELIAQEGEAIMPGFTGVKGERIRISSRTYGNKYTFVPGVQADSSMVKEKLSASIDSELVDKYVEAVGELPKGIENAVRERKVSITLND